MLVLRNVKDILASLHFFNGEAKDGWCGNFDIIMASLSFLGRPSLAQLCSAPPPFFQFVTRAVCCELLGAHADRGLESDVVTELGLGGAPGTPGAFGG